jgi:two-component system response regulator DesR
MTEEEALVLIAAEPGPLCDGLQALLTVVPHATAVSQAGDASSALLAVAETRPDLVLLDAGLPDAEIQTVVSRIKANGSGSRCLVLVEDLWQKQEALAAGADVALIKGTPATELFGVIEGLISQETQGDGVAE